MSASGMVDREIGVTENSCSQQHVPMPSSKKVDQQGELVVAIVGSPELTDPGITSVSPQPFNTNQPLVKVQIANKS